MRPSTFVGNVGISVPNIPEAVTYYTQKMGYREAFRVNDEKGQPRIVYLQISKNTFLELNPVTHGSSTCRSARTHFSSSTR